MKTAIVTNAVHLILAAAGLKPKPLSLRALVSLRHRAMQLLEHISVTVEAQKLETP